ncbi:hypothetical protein DFR58_104116 [Anaerobacterium chartisolvens]|uniref:HEAT repeat protein n=1 Tax=Anaerobacterium chartisolvens TaxID=1297424 RepID=A0A369BEE0_9FIRM|nr:hypothetical protein [Anaerobacterium chartisolvens]RCX18847.1 hypothetical protein DFR58_104116 [Anaerobacterium chartisolvens]
MKTKRTLILSGLLVMAIIFANIPVSAYSAMYNNGLSLFSKFFNMTEEDIYKSNLNDSAESLLAEIKALEQELKDDNSKIALVPHAMALIEKKDEFTPEEIILLLQDDETGAILESILIKMYIEKKADSNKLLPLLNDGKLSSDSKDYIVAIGDFSDDSLTDICYKYDNSVTVVAMKKLMTTNVEKAYQFASEILINDTKNVSDAKLWAASLGAGEYFNRFSGDDSEKKIIVEKLKELFSISKNEVVKDKFIYSLAKMNDFDVFKYIISDDKIDTDLKISTIERNVQMLVEKSTSKTSSSELSYIIKAMEIHPILEVGEALQQSLKSRTVPQSEELMATVKHIENNGIKGVFKYEQN